MDKIVEADEALEEAVLLRKPAVDSDKDRAPEDLMDADFNDLVAFWSR